MNKLGFTGIYKLSIDYNIYKSPFSSGQKKMRITKKMENVRDKLDKRGVKAQTDIYAPKKTNIFAALLYTGADVVNNNFLHSTGKTESQLKEDVKKAEPLNLPVQYIHEDYIIKQDSEKANKNKF